MIWCDIGACTAQVVSYRNRRHLGGNRAAADPTSRLAPGLFDAVATFYNAMQVELAVTCCI
jgi:hypothetical protein